ncbi:MAG TPA: hypothetical protein VGS79_12630 [Puia sp.]|nr:hypothetical protein [Puia sp.]
MERTEAKPQLTAIRDNLPVQYSPQSARKLMSSYENYKHVVQALGNRNAALLSGVKSEFSDIEFDIRWAIKGTPKKDAESRFAEAKRHITEDINSILDNL